MKPPFSEARQVAALLILLAGQAMATMDGSILAVTAPSLRTSLHASGAELQLVVAAYTMAFAALVVTGARLGDVFGRTRAFVNGLAAFTVASLAAGLAPAPPVLIVARAFQGAAAALMTAQVLSIIQTQFDGEQRARAIGTYSMILAVGVAAGQLVGGLLVGAHLMSAAWRPALLAMVVPLSFGRDYGWPIWVWPCFAVCVLAGCAFVALERRLLARGRRPLFDLRLLHSPRVGSGVLAILLGMACYAGVLLSLTLYLQDALRFSALHAGLIFGVYASGFAGASLTWTRARGAVRERLPVLGPLVMGAAVLAVGLIAGQGGWPLGLTTPLLLIAGVGHACGFSPLANRLTTLVEPARAADLSGLILTADFVGMALGAASFVGLYLSAAAHGSAHALAITAGAIAAALTIAAGCAWRALAPGSE